MILFCPSFIDVPTCVTCLQVSRPFDMAIGEPEGRDVGRMGRLELDEHRDQGLRRERPRRAAERQGPRLCRGEAARIYVRDLRHAGEEHPSWMQRAN